MPAPIRRMMTLEDHILAEVQYFASPESDLPRSILAFGVTQERATTILDKAKALFERIGLLNEKRRSEEITALLDSEAGLVFDKYDELKKTYANRLSEINAWEGDAFSAEYSRVLHIPTYLKERIKGFQLIDFNVGKFYAARRRSAELSELVNLEILERIHRDPKFARHYQKTQRDIEYEQNEEYIRARYDATYACVWNISEPLNDHFKLKHLFRPFMDGTVKWSVVLFEPNHSFWASQYADKLGELLYPNRKIFDEAVNITPIENRLKEALDRRGIMYSFHHPIGPYVLDFYFEINGRCLNVECDGREYHSSNHSIEHDRIRNDAMATRDIYVLRFNGSDIWKNAEACVDTIESALSLKVTK